MKTLVITQAEIDNATRPDASTCPIALALSVATGRPWEVTDEWLFDVDNNRLFEPVSRGLRDFALAWDRRQPVKPCTVRLPKGIINRKQARSKGKECEPMHLPPDFS